MRPCTRRWCSSRRRSAPGAAPGGCARAPGRATARRLGGRRLRGKGDWAGLGKVVLAAAAGCGGIVRAKAAFATDPCAAVAFSIECKVRLVERAAIFDIGSVVTAYRSPSLWRADRIRRVKRDNRRFVPVLAARDLSRAAWQEAIPKPHGQASKRGRWMPWQLEAMKDVVACDKPRGAGKQALIRGCPNGETHPSSGGYPELNS